MIIDKSAVRFIGVMVHSLRAARAYRSKRVSTVECDRLRRRSCGLILDGYTESIELASGERTGRKAHLGRLLHFSRDFPFGS
jgi:hypothetical protein